MKVALTALSVLVLVTGCTGPNSASGRRQFLAAHASELTDAERAAIREGRVLVGMTPGAVLAAWGDTPLCQRSCRLDLTVGMTTAGA